jgi:nitrite reductase (cytochrome c-552)
MEEFKSAQKNSKLRLIVFIVVAVLVFVAGLFTASIIERRSERSARFQIVKEIAEWEPRNEVWGENYPREYETYLMMLDTTFRTKYGGSAFRDYLEESPELVIMWAGYAFSKEYNQGRGHAFAIEDIRRILRTGGVADSPMPATCWTCKSPDVPRMMAKMGIEEFYKSKWFDLGSEIVNPIGCQDCHEPNTMKLRITRPALIEAFKRQGKDINSFSHNEMRSLVCAQCHVEYYFKGDGKYLTFPWDKGFSADSMEAYYNEIEFKDWEHKLSKTPMLKAQHPDYELYMTGIHAARGVSCADCHMPYRTEGGVKFTNHHITSPLRYISTSCQVCHRQSEEQLRKDVEDRQNRVFEIRRIAEKSIAAAQLEAQIALKAGATDEEMLPIQKLLRSAQWRWDWVAAANGMGFHSPVEALRVLGTSIERSEKARGLLNVLFAKHGAPIPAQLGDYSNKAKAQLLIGLDMEKLHADKNELLEKICPQWDEEAKTRQGSLKKY